MTAGERVAASRKDQGFEEHVTDVSVLARVAAMVARATRAEP